MKIAVPIWQYNVSTCFDFAHRLMVVERESKKETERYVIPIRQEALISRVKQLRELETNVLICGAISKFLAEYISADGIEIIPFITGPVDSVLDAYFKDHLRNPAFHLPGCLPGWEKRWQGRCRFRKRKTP